MAVALKVGALAERTGVTVRTLHHYDEIGLLSPSFRTRSGHRVYGADEISRLQQIASLRQLGLALGEIKGCLNQSAYSLERVLEMQLQRLRAQIGRQERLVSLLSELKDRLGSSDGATVDQIMSSIDATLHYEKYFSDEQLETLRERRGEVGEDRMRAAADDWQELFAEFGRALEDGLDPSDGAVAQLARRARGLIEEFTGGDPGVTASLTTMYASEGPTRVMAAQGMQMPRGLWEYMAKARAALDAD